MTFQAYLDTIKEKTGLTPADFAKLAAKRGLVKRADLMAWLKTEYGLGHGHANVIAHLLVNADAPPVPADTRIDKHFAGKKAGWRKPYDSLLTKLGRFGKEFRVAPTNSYLSLLRGDQKFGILAVTADRFDVGALPHQPVIQGWRRRQQGGFGGDVIVGALDDVRQIDLGALAGGRFAALELFTHGHGH